MPLNDSISFRQLDTLLGIENGRLRQVLDLWSSRRRGGALPARADFDAIELMRFGGIITLVDVEHAPERFRFRLVGSDITRMLDRDSTGRFLDELYHADTYDIVVAGYRHCIANREPARGYGRMVHANSEFLPFESVDLPLAADGYTVDMIMKAAIVGREPRDPLSC